MFSRNVIYSAMEPAVLSSGLFPDVHELKRPLWAEAQNVRFYSGKIVRNVPSALISLPIAGFTPRGLAQQQASDGTRWLWMAGLAEVYRWFGPAAELAYTFTSAGNVNQTSNAPATYIDMLPWGNWMVLNNGLDQVVLWKAIGDAAAIVAAPPIAVQYMKKFNFLLAFGCGSRRTRVEWSDADDIETWLPALGNLAGGISIDDFDTGIVGTSRLGQALSCYNEDQMAIVFYTGDQFVFGQKTVLDGIGAISKRSVVSDGGNNFGVGRNGIWWTDGSSAKYIDSGLLHDYLQENVNWAQGSKIHAARNDTTGCIDFYFPMQVSTVCTEGWSFDPGTGGWTPIYPCAVQDERKLFNGTVQGLDTTSAPYTKGDIRLMQQNPALDAPLLLVTKPLLAQVRTADGMVDNHTDWFVQEIDLLAKKALAVRWRLESSEDLSSWEVGAWQVLDKDTTTYLVDNMASGVYWRLRFESTATEWELDLQGFQLFGRVEGTRRTA